MTVVLVKREALVSNLSAGAPTKELQRNQKEMLSGLAAGGTWSTMMTVSRKKKIHSTIAIENVISASSGVSETNSATRIINVHNISDGGNGKAKEGAREKAK